MLPLDRQNAYRARYARLRPGWQPSGPQFESLVRQTLRPASRVLDLGCGRGGVMELFWREVRLTAGLDPDLASLRAHRAAMPRVCGVGEALPFAAASFDVVLALWVLEHVTRPAALLAEARRVLVPGGHFLFLTPNAHHPLLLANRFSWAFPAVQRVLVPRLYGRAEADTFRVRYQANTLERLRALAAAEGFTIASLRPLSDPTYTAFNDALFALSRLVERWLPPSLYVHLLGDFVRNG
ncbi:MAG: class I SAM-dependent methyltransferase [Anaerolineales bacterium]|nr:class I SAM-dependent methyltransferase [Anaerolineales bacterium]